MLARQATPARLTGQLVLLRHPDAARLSALTAHAQPALLDLERVLVAGFAERSLAAARAADRNLREAVRARIDVCNVEMALAVASGPRDVKPETLFTAGGVALPLARFVEACRAPSAVEAAQHLEGSLAGHPLQAVVRSAGGNPARLESACPRPRAGRAASGRQARPPRQRALVLFLLRLQAQSSDLRRLAWGAALGARRTCFAPSW